MSQSIRGRTIDRGRHRCVTKLAKRTRRARSSFQKGTGNGKGKSKGKDKGSVVEG